MDLETADEEGVKTSEFLEIPTKVTAVKKWENLTKNGRPRKIMVALKNTRDVKLALTKSYRIWGLPTESNLFILPALKNETFTQNKILKKTREPVSRSFAKKRLRIRNFELITKNLKTGLDSDSDEQATEYQKIY